MALGSHLITVRRLEKYINDVIGKKANLPDTSKTIIGNISQINSDLSDMLTIKRVVVGNIAEGTTSRLTFSDFYNSLAVHALPHLLDRTLLACKVYSTNAYDIFYLTGCRHAGKNVTYVFSGNPGLVSIQYRIDNSGLAYTYSVASAGSGSTTINADHNNSPSDTSSINGFEVLYYG